MSPTKVFGDQEGNIKYSKMTEKDILPKQIQYNTIQYNIIQTSKSPFCRPNKMGFIVGTGLGLLHGDFYFVSLCLAIENGLLRREITSYSFVPPVTWCTAGAQQGRKPSEGRSW